MFQMGWWIYGQIEYYSDEALECSEKKSFLMDLISIFLLYQTLKVIMFLMALVILAIICIVKKR